MIPFGQLGFHGDGIFILMMQNAKCNKCRFTSSDQKFISGSLCDMVLLMVQKSG